MDEPTIETVRKVARLARLDLDEREALELGAQFERILEHFRDLSRVDVEGVEPMLSAAAGSGLLREDSPRPSLPAEALLDRAPARSGDHYEVPKTVGGAP